MDPRKLSAGADLLRLSTVGLNFVFSVFTGLFLGWGATRLFHCGDWAILVGILTGIVSGYLLVFEAFKSLPSGRKDPRNDPSN